MRARRLPRHGRHLSRRRAPRPSSSSLPHLPVPPGAPTGAASTSLHERRAATARPASSAPPCRGRAPPAPRRRRVCPRPGNRSSRSPPRGRVSLLERFSASLAVALARPQEPARVPPLLLPVSLDVVAATSAPAGARLQEHPSHRPSLHPAHAAMLSLVAHLQCPRSWPPSPSTANASTCLALPRRPPLIFAASSSPA
jgi:hypothetical protein